MAVFYYKTFAHIREVEQKAQDLKGRPQQGAATLTAAPTPAPALAGPIRAGQTASQVAMVALPAARGSNGSAITTPQRSLPPSAPASRDHSRLGAGGAGPALPGSAAAAAAGARDESVVVQIGAAGQESKVGGTATSTRAWGIAPASGVTVPSASLDAGEGQAVTVAIDPAAAVTAAPAAAAATPSSGSGGAPTVASAEARRAAMKERKSKSLAFSMLKRGLGLISVYYFCWAFVSINGALALGDVHYTSLWPEMIAAWLIKLSPLIDALILGDLMRRAAANKAGAARAVGGVGQTRIDADSSQTAGSSAQSSAAEPMVVRRVAQKGSPAPAVRTIGPGGGAGAGAGGPGAAANKRASGSYNVANTGAGAVGTSSRVRHPSTSQLQFQGGSALASPVHLGRRITPGTGTGSGSASATPRLHVRDASADLTQLQQQQQGEAETAAGAAAAPKPVLPARGTFGGSSVDGGWVFPGLTAISDAPANNSVHAQLSPAHALQGQGQGSASAQSHSRASSSVAGGVVSTTLVTPLLHPSLSGSSSPGPATSAQSDRGDSAGAVVVHVRLPNLAPSPVAEDPAAEEAQQSPWPAGP